MPEALILCGGRSRRMGRDKALIVVDGLTCLERVWRAVAPVSSRARLVTDDAARYGDLGRDAIVDWELNAGPVAALARALPEVTAEHAFVGSCDMPFMEAAYFRMLHDVIGDADACLPLDGAVRAPLAALYHRRVGEMARAFRARGGARLLDLVATLRIRPVARDELERFPEELLWNLNTQKDVRAARRRAAQRREP